MFDGDIDSVSTVLTLLANEAPTSVVLESAEPVHDISAERVRLWERVGDASLGVVEVYEQGSPGARVCSSIADTWRRVVAGSACEYGAEDLTTLQQLAGLGGRQTYM